MSSQGETVTRPQGRPRRPRRRWRYAVAAAVVVAAAAGGFRMAGLGAASPDKAGSKAERTEADDQTPRVEVVRPRRGGIERTTVQPGSVHSFESVELYAMVSGYLKTQEVDIGSRVKQGQVLAEIDVPREESAAAEGAALLEQSKAQARQMEAKLKSVEAERDTAAAAVDQAAADVDRFVANRRLAESQYARVKNLSDRNAVDRRLVDEQQRDMEASVAAEKAARLAVLSAKSRLLAAEAKVEQARADVAEAKASIGVAEARVAKAKVDLQYAKITAPFAGVVTHRNFHPGSFIRAASGSTPLPLLTVSRTDLMRVVVRVPDRDVVLTDPGDKAVVTIDSLQGRAFKGTVSRIGESEDHTTRTMRVEIDLPNPDGLLREGMYGRATIHLEPPSERLTVPVACVVERPAKGKGVVQVVRDGKVRRVKVDLGADNGTLVEVASGVGADDEVVLRTSTPLEDDMTVVAKAAG